MKYTIMGFNQKFAYEWGLTTKELVFLRWFLDFMATGRMEHIVKDNKIYFWVDNKTVIEELPILRIRRTDNLRRFLRNLIEKGILEYTLHRGNKPFYRFNSEKAYLLISHPSSRGGLSEKTGGAVQKDSLSFYKDPSINKYYKF